MTSGDIRTLILSRLVQQHGGSRSIWSRALGELRVYGMSTHPHCNWDARPAGSSAQVEKIGRVVDDVRSLHPHVDPAETPRRR